MVGQAPTGNGAKPHITVRDLTMAFGSFVLMRDLNFAVNHGDVFIIMGGSGSGKSTLLRHMIGLIEPAQGNIFFGDENFTKAEPEQRQELLRRMGVLFQTGGLWSSMTLAENIGMLLEEYTRLRPSEIREVASLKLALVGLKGFEDYYPSQISGGMQKRAGLARAMALDPEVLFFDEPSAGLDPIVSGIIDKLMTDLTDKMGITSLVVTHDMHSAFRIAHKMIMLHRGRIVAAGTPEEIQGSSDPLVHQFITGAPDGPIPLRMSQKDYQEDILGL